MAALLQQYGLGLKGVNRVSNPIDLKEGELRLAQNAALSTKYGRAALIKRKGMALLSWAQTVGGLWAIAPLPFEDPDPGVDHYGYPGWGLPLDPPVVPTMTTASTTSVTWTWPAVPGATGYYVDVSDDGFATFIEENVEEPSNTHTVTGLPPGSEVQIRVRTDNNDRPGPNSDPGDGETEPSTFPATGTFYVAAASTVACDWDVVSGSTLEGQLSCPDGVGKALSFSFDGGLLYLNNDIVPTDPASLPAGFRVVSGAGYLASYSPDPGTWGQHACKFGGAWWQNYGAEFTQLPWEDSPGLLDDLIQVHYETNNNGRPEYGWPPELARLLADTTQGRIINPGNGLASTPNPYIWGSYDLNG